MVNTFSDDPHQDFISKMSYSWFVPSEDVCVMGRAMLLTTKKWRLAKSLLHQKEKLLLIFCLAYMNVSDKKLNRKSQCLAGFCSFLFH